MTGITEIQLARAIADKAWEHAQTLRDKADQAEAEWTRLRLLEIAGGDAAVSGFYWTCEYDYGDGEFFEVAHGCPVFDPAAVRDDELDTDDRIMDMSVPADVVRLLCTTHDTRGDDSHEVTIGELAAKSFA